MLLSKPIEICVEEVVFGRPLFVSSIVKRSDLLLLFDVFVWFFVSDLLKLRRI